MVKCTAFAVQAEQGQVLFDIRVNLPYAPVIARRNCRIISRELCSIVPSW